VQCSTPDSRHRCNGPTIQSPTAHLGLHLGHLRRDLHLVLQQPLLQPRLRGRGLRFVVVRAGALLPVGQALQAPQLGGLVVREGVAVLLYGGELVGCVGLVCQGWWRERETTG